MDSKSKWTLAGLSSVLALSVLLPTANADLLNELEQKKQQAEQQQSELNSGISDKTKAISKNQSTLEKIMAEINKLVTQTNETKAKIASVEGDIELTKQEIENLQASISELEFKITERTELLQERARAIQLSGGSVEYIDVLLGANSFVDFIDRVSAVNTLIEADREIMREQGEDKKLLAEQKAQVETKLAQQENRHAELEKLKSSLDSQKAKQAGLKKDLQIEQERLAREKANLVQQYEETIEISAELEKQIAAEQARLAELARKAEEERLQKLAAARAAAEKAAAQKRTVSPTPATSYSSPVSSEFIRPTSGRFTSDFGWRNIGSGPEFHQGVDIANSIGTNVVASANGFVSYAGSMGGYGNVVIVTHSLNGQTHATVYAHLNSIGVSMGQAVDQGQSVGQMGNTGRSSGSHLHFEIHVGPWNGARSNAVNPENFVSLR